MRCGKLFDSWVDKLKSESGMFVLRCVHTGRVWRTMAVVDAFGLESHWDTWRGILFYADPADVRIIEDAHSRALKLGGVHYFEVRGRMDPTSTAKFMCACKAVWCEGCANRCAVIIHGAELAAASVSLLEFP